MSEVSAGKVLLATDGSEDAALAARVAADVATTIGREVHVVHVLEPLPRYAYPGKTPEIYSLVYDKRRTQAGDLLARKPTVCVAKGSTSPRSI
jgi:nucleotide-binding universal stress UspA family protein